MSFLYTQPTSLLIGLLNLFKKVTIIFFTGQSCSRERLLFFSCSRYLSQRFDFSPKIETLFENSLAYETGVTNKSILTHGSRFKKNTAVRVGAGARAVQKCD